MLILKGLVGLLLGRRGTLRRVHAVSGGEGRRLRGIVREGL